ncbi:MAG: amidohydrolase family protein [SAR324 cluster bacterium]|nr:amidohydrolase family protein [SAR324 cluster bacterium]
MTIKTCLPPVAETRTPQFVPPSGACDAHCHIFGPAAKYPYAPDRSYTPPDAPLERFKELQKTLGLERAVLVNASCHGTDNTVILDAISQSEGQYRGVANVDGSFSDKDLELLDKGGIRGVRFNFVQHLGGTPSLDLFAQIVDRIKAFNWHVVLHFDASDLLEFNQLLHTLPVPFVIDHMGRVPTGAGLDQKPFQRLLELAQHENCWVKICGAERISSSGPPFTDAVPFAQALVKVCEDRILWGTDWPHPNIKKYMPNDGDLVDLIPLILPDQALQRKILVENPDRLYKFGL